MTTTTTTTTSLRSDPRTGWVTGAWDGLKVQAKVYDEPSHCGIEVEPRISKLWVATPAGLELFNYDRGHDVNHLKADALAAICAAVVAAA